MKNKMLLLGVVLLSVSCCTAMIGYPGAPIQLAAFSLPRVLQPLKLGGGYGTHGSYGLIPMPLVPLQMYSGGGVHGNHRPLTHREMELLRYYDNDD